MNKLSIILVSYNRPEYLKQAIDSMLMQTYSEWELLVMDYSNSKYEEVKKILDEYQKDKRIRVFYHTEYDPKNISICWNEALDLMTGEYWGLLDDDDTKMPMFAEMCVNELDKNPQFEAVAYGTQNIGTRHGACPVQTAFTIDDLRAANRIGSGSIVYRKNVFNTIGYFDPKMVYAEDWEYLLRFCLMIGKNKIKFLNELLIGYRWHDDKRQYIDNYPALLKECVDYMLGKKMEKQKHSGVIKQNDKESISLALKLTKEEELKKVPVILNTPVNTPVNTPISSPKEPEPVIIHNKNPHIRPSL